MAHGSKTHLEAEVTAQCELSVINTTDVIQEAVVLVVVVYMYMHCMSHT